MPDLFELPFPAAWRAEGPWTRRAAGEVAGGRGAAGVGPLTACDLDDGDLDDGDLVELLWADGLVTWTTRGRLAAAAPTAAPGATPAAPGADPAGAATAPLLPLERPSGFTERGVGGVVLRAWQVLRASLDGDHKAALGGLIRDADAALCEDGPALRRVAAAGPTTLEDTPSDAELATGRWLVLVHGTFSSVPVGFGALAPPAARADWQRLRDRYEGRILAYQHPTLSVSPAANALDLANRLPPGANVDVIGHSRGGLVAELLVAAPPPHVLDALRRAADGPERALARDLLALAELRAARPELVRRVMRVAAPMRGTRIASGRVDEVLDGLAAVVNVTLPAIAATFPAAAPAAIASSGVVTAARALVRVVTEDMAHDPEVAPGFAAMRPDGLLPKYLNPALAPLGPARLVVAGVFTGSGGTPGAVQRMLPEAFFGGDNDLVVETDRMYAEADHGASHAVEPDGPGIHHSAYFADAPTRALLVDWLAAPDGAPVRGVAPAARPTVAAEARGPLDYLRELPRRAPTGTGEVAVVVPGLLGSTLAVDGERVWVDLPALIRGRFAELEPGKRSVEPTGLVRESYEPLVRALERAYDVAILPLDGRRSLETAVQALAELIGPPLAAGRRVHLVAHSMGGLVARGLAAWAPQVWAALRGGGGRLVMMGTPNHGSWDAVATLLGEDRVVRALAAADLVNDGAEIVRILRTFELLLAMVPDALTNGPSLWDADTWTALGVPAEEAPALGARLAVARKARRELAAAWDDTLPGGVSLLLGSAPSPHSGLVLGPRGRAWLPEGDPRGDGPGDGTVTHARSRLRDVPAWWVDAPHDELPRHPDTLALIPALLRGASPPRTAPPLRDRGALAPVAPLAGYPTAADLTGTAAPRRKRGRVVRVSVTHGTVEDARYPILVGLGRHEDLRGPLHRLDRALDGELGRLHAAGMLPEELGRHKIVGGPTATALVVGLGDLAALTPTALAQAVRTAVADHLHAGRASDPASRAGRGLSVLLPGPEASVAPAAAVHAVVEGVSRALGDLAAWPDVVARFGELEIVEVREDRAARAAHAAHHVAAADPFGFDLGLRWEPAPQVRLGSRQRASGPDRRDRGPAWRTLTFTDHGDHLAYVFAAGTAVARPGSVALGGPLDADALRGTTRHDPSGPSWRLARTLFGRLLPRDLRGTLLAGQPVSLGLDERTARIPWELLTDPQARDERPLATRIGLVRTLAAPPREDARLCRRATALVVGDAAGGTSGLGALPGADREARQVAALLGQERYEVTRLGRDDAPDTLRERVEQALAGGRYRVLHVAAHGIHQEPSAGHVVTGITFGRAATTWSVLGAQALVGLLGELPELVFFNCCHLGRTEEDELQPGAGRHALAASVASEFVTRGVRAVVVAGWAVDDAAANVFARSFYAELLAGAPFGDAVREARLATWRSDRTVNTWGAYQAYGDPTWTLVTAAAPRRRDVGRAQVEAEVLDLLDDLTYEASVRGPARDPDDTPAARLRDLDDAVPAQLRTAAVLGALGDAWGALGVHATAVERLREALGQDRGTLTVRQVEQLANFEGRQAAGLDDPEAARALFRSSKRRLLALLRIAETPERWCLLGATRTREADRAPASDRPALRRAARVAYERAAAMSARDGMPYYYPEHTAALLALLTDADIEALTTIARRLEAATDAVDRWRERRDDTWTRVAPLDLRFSRLLVAVARGATPPADALAPARALGADYREMLRFNVSPGESDSIRRGVDGFRGQLAEHAPTSPLLPVADAVLAELHAR